jgi:hypothetical protein
MMPAYAHLKLLGSIDPNFWLSFVHLDRPVISLLFIDTSK